MIELNLTFFKKIFIALGITQGPDAFTSKEFASALSFRIQAFTFSLYLYLDTMDGFTQRAMEVAGNKFNEFNKGYLAGKTDASTNGAIIGRA